MMRRNKKWTFYAVSLILAIFLAGAAGCGTAMDKAGAPMEAMADVAMEMAGRGASAPSSADGEASAKDFDMRDDSQPPGEAGRRYIILNARLTLEIEDIEVATKEIQSGVNQLGGYVSSLELYDLTRERRAGYISLRIPEDKYDHALEMIGDLGKIKNIHENVDDVTMHYIDLEARITNLEAQEKRMRDLLEKAETIEEILQIERELGRIRGDLEARTAEFKYLRERVNYSTLDIRLEEKDPRTQTVVDGFGTFGERVNHLLALNTNRLLEGITNFLVVSIGSLPILVPLLVSVFVVWKIAAVLRRKKKAAGQTLVHESSSGTGLPGDTGKS